MYIAIIPSTASSQLVQYLQSTAINIKSRQDDSPRSSTGRAYFDGTGTDLDLEVTGDRSTGAEDDLQARVRVRAVEIEVNPDAEMTRLNRRNRSLVLSGHLDVEFLPSSSLDQSQSQTHSPLDQLRRLVAEIEELSQVRAP